MNEADIRATVDGIVTNLMLAIAKKNQPREVEKLGVAVIEPAIALVTQVLVDINRCADALEKIADGGGVR